ncbi:MAG: hypothetical protein PHW82_03390 [Bacteroidales bacterium]|nr:hypothetical protein [Bacteroidales bacterium]
MSFCHVLRKNTVLLFVGIVISLIGYTQEILIKTIDSNNNLPIAFVKISSNATCMGFTNENGILIINKSDIINDTILLSKSIYHSKEVNVVALNDNFSVDLEKLNKSISPYYSNEDIFTLIQQTLDNSQKNSPKKQFLGVVNYLFTSSLSSNPVVKKEVKMPFFITSTKIKALVKIDKTIKVWLKSTLNSEPIRYRAHKPLYKKSAYSYAVDSSYINALGETILIVSIKNNKFHRSQLIINNSKKAILEFHNYWNAGNDHGISEPDYHAIYSLNDDLLCPEYLLAKYCYKKNEEIDVREIQIRFK